MELLVRRYYFGEDCTIGELFVDNLFACYTLEDPKRTGPKVPGATAIPAGRYELDLTWSPRFKAKLPLLLDVPGFTAVRIHAGNTAADTEGCILVGEHKEKGAITGSRAALNVLIAKLTLPAHITIEDII